MKKLRVVSGDPVLAEAAVEGVRQWKFEPTVLDGKAVEVESDVQIKFKLSVKPPSKHPSGLCRGRDILPKIGIRGWAICEKL